MMVTLEELHCGRTCTVFAVVVDGDCEASGYLMELSERARVKMRANIELLADTGFIWNEEKFRRLEPGIFELKLRRPPLRLFCFQDGRDWVCTHGSTKPGRRELRAHIARVRALRERWRKENA